MSYPNSLLAALLIPTKRRCFISYHHRDELEVREFIRVFSDSWDTFTARALGIEFDDDIVQSNDTDYVMRCIRERYMAYTSVTIVMVGRCTLSRKYVDWEIAASLRNAGGPANGILGIRLPSYVQGDGYPDRLNDNLLPADQVGIRECYARCITYPDSRQTLIDAIEAAYNRRTSHAMLINNTRQRMLYNRPCI